MPRDGEGTMMRTVLVRPLRLGKAGRREGEDGHDNGKRSAPFAKNNRYDSHGLTSSLQAAMRRAVIPLLCVTKPITDLYSRNASMPKRPHSRHVVHTYGH